MMTLGKLDLQILVELSKDGRRSLRSLAEDLNKSPTTIKKHLDKLEEKNYIRNYGATLNYNKLGYNEIALIEIIIDKGKMIQVEKEISRNPHVFGVFDVTGEYDAVILARFKDKKNLSSLIKEINSNEFVLRTNTHIILNLIKDGWDFAKLIESRSQ
jgi:DNA-binding Lrp family transcriptional regulator